MQKKTNTSIAFHVYQLYMFTRPKVLNKIIEYNVSMTYRKYQEHSAEMKADWDYFIHKMLVLHTYEYWKNAFSERENEVRFFE